MEITREIYWNIGHGVVLPMYLLVVASFAFAFWGFYRRYQLWMKGKPVNRVDHLARRIITAFSIMITQRQVLRVKKGGLSHSLFFWGFLVLFLGTLLVMVQADLVAPVFHTNLLSGKFYLLFSLALDMAGVLAILGLTSLSIRRFLLRPPGLVTARDDVWMHALLFAVLVSGFFLEAFRMAATEMHRPELAMFSPAGYVLAGFFAESQNLELLHTMTWWLHFALVLSFIASLPWTKFRHILTTPANQIFADRRPTGSLTTIHLEDETVESFGAARVADLTWKDLFDTDACTSCKRCQDVCPAHHTSKPLSPMRIIHTLGKQLQTDPDGDLLEAEGRDALWSCTTCRACVEICPAGVEHTSKIIEMRRSLSLMSGEFPGDEVQIAMQNLEVNGNPFGLSFASRGDWADGLNVPTLQDDPDVDVLYFAGCYASFDKRNKESARNFITLARAAGVKVGILGKEEKCCGEPVRKLGNEYLYQTLAAENIALFQGYNVKKIVVTCPHCLQTLSKDYRDLGFQGEVVHATSFLADLAEQHRLPFKKQSLDCTFHDSCYLGRYNSIYDAPRVLLHSTGAHIREMQASHHNSFCCGGGGGRILAEEKLGERINARRASMAHETGAQVLVSSCPFCLSMFDDGIKTGSLEGTLQARDLMDVLVERLDIRSEQQGEK